MKVNPMGVTLAEVANKLKWGKFLYTVVPHITLGTNKVKEYSLLVFDYDMETVELFHKSQMLGQVVRDNEGNVLVYEDCSTSDSVHHIIDTDDIPLELTRLALRKECEAVDIKDLANSIVWDWSDESN